ncbi:MAG: phosphoglucosamine mutase [Deltaproteobacteria bacterium]|nr:phosphoglucosamine mutase [Deltaproteobacteria bacterium]
MAPVVSFGTDGLRGRAGTFPIEADTAARLGRILGARLGTIVVARDTRVSGPALVAGVARGVAEAGGSGVDVGVLPTPGLSVLVALGWGRCGVMVTASHNPPDENGLKVLGPDGRKLSDEAQSSLEDALASDLAERSPPRGDRPLVDRARVARDAYLDALLGRIPDGRWLEGRRVVADAAHGAACHTLPEVLARLGATVEPLACEEDGTRINVGVGALHPKLAAAHVLETGADVGIALDGDGDRVALVTASGRVLEGDALLFLLAKPPAVVGTIMTNAGVESALARRGIALFRAPVGDRNVEAERMSRALTVGAEPSGHVCLADGLPTSDGALTALSVLAAGFDLDERMRGCPLYPRAQRAVRVQDRPPLEEVPGLAQARTRALAALGPGGRLILRYSGTEPVLRLLVEGRRATRVEAVAQAFTRFLEEAIGSDP